MVVEKELEYQKYVKLLKKYIKEYGENTTIFYMLGSFYEFYDGLCVIF